MSVLLFAADIFTIRLAAGITDIGLAGAFTAWSWTKKKLSFRICFPFRKYALCFLILAVAMPFAAGKFGYFGMGQDEGVYQTHAIQLMYGENSRQLDFPEYTQLNMKEREACQDAVVSHLLGFYTVDEYGTISGYDTETMSRASGIFHGIPNYAAMLALSGRISGIAHMMDIQTVFYILSILLFFMITENLGWKRLTGGIPYGIAGIFPSLDMGYKISADRGLSADADSGISVFYDREPVRLLSGSCGCSDYILILSCSVCGIYAIFCPDFSYHQLEKAFEMLGSGRNRSSCRNRSGNSCDDSGESAVYVYESWLFALQDPSVHQ